MGGDYMATFDKVAPIFFVSIALQHLEGLFFGLEQVEAEVRH